MHKKSWNIRIVDECDSTNRQIKLLRAKDGLSDRTALMTNFQHSGRGQGKNFWHSSRKKNLLVSFYRKIDIPVSKNFMLTVIISLALHRLLKNHGIECLIKWPNDIYFGDKKIAGVLIENSLMRTLINDTIIGVGLNINESNFPENLPNACSMLEINGKHYKPEIICDELICILDNLFQDFQGEFGIDLYHNYIGLLFRFGQWHLFRKDEHTFNARIHGVEPDGRLILETEGGQLMHLWFGEVEYVI